PDPQPDEQMLAAAAGAGMRAVLAAMPGPAFLRDAAGHLSYANAAYAALARSAGRSSPDTSPAELLEPGVLQRHLTALAERRPQRVAVTLGAAGSWDLSEFPAGDGSAGLLAPRIEAAPAREAGLDHLG